MCMLIVYCSSRQYVFATRTLALSSLSSLSLFFPPCLCLSTGAPAYSLQLPEGQIEEQYHIIVDDNDVMYGVVCRFSFSFLFCVCDWFFLYLTRLHIHTYLSVHTITGEYRKVVSSSSSLLLLLLLLSLWSLLFHINRCN